MTLLQATENSVQTRLKKDKKPTKPHMRMELSSLWWIHTPLLSGNDQFMCLLYRFHCFPMAGVQVLYKMSFCLQPKEDTSPREGLWFVWFQWCVCCSWGFGAEYCNWKPCQNPKEGERACVPCSSGRIGRQRILGSRIKLHQAASTPLTLVLRFLKCTFFKMWQ